MLKKKKTCEIKQYQLKLRTNKKLEAKLDSWLRHLSAVYNWGLRKIELNAQSKIYFKQEQFINLLANHSGKLDIPSHTIQGILATAYDSWNRCFKKKAKKPKLKSVRNKLNSIPFPDALRRGSVDRLTNKTVKLPSLGVLRYFKQTIPDGNITCSRLIKKAGDWYLCLFIEVKPKVIERTSSNEIGIDPGFKDLLTMSDGVKLPRPVEMSKKAKRLAQAQRGYDKKLTRKLNLKVANQRRDRNHKLSLKLVQENVLIAFSKDNHKAIARRFGKSVCNSAHYQLQQMLKHKSRTGGTQYIEVDSKNSTRTCSSCGCLNIQLTGFAGLSIRQWKCSVCGANHDRDVNAAINTLIAGAGIALERLSNAA